jgi:DnaK suppressor protein
VVVATEFDNLLKSLLEQKSEILNKSHEFRQQQTDRPQLSDEADLASGLIEESLSLRLQEKDRRTLLQIERALGKISAGTYGECEDCGQEIGQRRLEVHPFSTTCVSCREEQEANRPLQ